MKEVGEKKREELKAKVLEDLVMAFPQCKGRVVFSEVSSVVQTGLSHTPVRFAASCVRPKTVYDGLYLGGEDITYDSFLGRAAAGILACNALLGYTCLDLLWLEKNVAADIGRLWKDARGGQGEEDLFEAVGGNGEGDKKDN
jgi:hypothetical protein